MNTISAVISTNNEGDVLEDALKSISWADEIVVVDGGSNDATIGIAKKYTQNIHIDPGQQHIHINKNRAISLAKCVWVLLIDADERISPELVEEIKKTCQMNKHQGYYIPRKNYAFGKWLRHGGNYPDYQLRLFKNGLGKYPARIVHEQIEVKGAVGYLKTPIIHFFASRGLDYWISKINTYSTIEAKNMHKENCQTNILNIIGRPLRFFLYVYFVKKGFLDGVPGLITASMASFSIFMRYAKLYQMKQ